MTLMNIDTVMGVLEFCIPKSHPVSAKVPKAAGAPQMQIEKYLRAIDVTLSGASMNLRMI